MARLYLFAIGGTGARVLKSLCHLLAAGTPLRDERGRPVDLVPLVIDPDRENGDTLECLATLADYTRVQAQFGSPAGGEYPCGFFQTRILSYTQLLAAMPDLARGAVTAARPDADLFRSGAIDAAKTMTFGEVIAYDFLESEIEGEASRLLVDALYAPENLATRLTGGFLGNPNVGTVVLNQLRHSPELQLLASLLTSEDRIFIISSIFGGTGAAGFPVLVKQFRQAKTAQGQDATALRSAPIGALSVLPYFGLEDSDDSPVDANAFIPKTKAALAYYVRFLGGVNALYYIGDRPKRRYANRPTGSGQRNPDHIVELIGATSILHFAALPAAQLASPLFNECAAQMDAGPLTLRGHGSLAELIERPLTQFAMLRLLLAGMASPDAARLLLAQPWAKEGGFDPAFFDATAPAIGPLRSYLQRWWQSLTAMMDNDPSLQLFGDTFSALRLDVTARTPIDANAIHMALNLLERRRGGPVRSLQRLLTLLWNGTASLYTKSYDAAATGGRGARA